MSVERTVHTQMYSNRGFTHDLMLEEATRYADNSNQLIVDVNDHTRTAGVWLVRLTKKEKFVNQIELAI